MSRKLLTELEKIIEDNDSFLLKNLISLELIKEYSDDFIPILKCEPDNYIEIDVEVLQNLIRNCKIAESILLQSILNNFNNPQEFKDYCLKNNVEFNFDELFVNKFRIPTIELYNYQKMLTRNKELIDDNLLNFLDFLESDQKENASFAYEELNEKQKKSIPIKILRWLDY